MAASGGTQAFLFGREATYGTQSTAQYKTFRATRGSVRRTVRSVESALIRGDRQGAGSQPVFFASEGSLQSEIICGDAAHNELIARALWSSYSNTDLADDTKGHSFASGALTLTTSTALNTLTRSAGSFITDGVVAGCWLGLFGAGADEGWWKVVSVDSATVLTLAVPGISFAGANIADLTGVAGTGDEKYSIAFARNYAEKIGLTVERGFTDVTKYLRMTGGVVSKFGMNLQSEQLATITCELLGTGYNTGTSSGDASPDAAGSNNPVSASTHVARIYKGGSTLAAVRRLEYALDNRVTQLGQIGQSTAADVIAGTYAITGTIEAYFTDPTILEDLLGTQAAFAVESVFVDSAGNLFSVNLPAVNLTGGGIDESGSDDPVVASYPFAARLASGGNHLIQIDSIVKPA